MFDPEKPKVIEKGTFGEDGWSISIGNVDDEDTKDWNKRGLRSKNKIMGSTATNIRCHL